LHYQRKHCVTLYVAIIWGSGCSRPDGADTAASDCLAQIIRRIKREVVQSTTRFIILQICVGRVRLESAHRGLDSADSAQTQPAGHARDCECSKDAAPTYLHTNVILVRSEHSHD
jgi:hypothetical protein